MSSEVLVDALIAASGVMIVAWVAAAMLRCAPAALRNSVWRAALIGVWLASALVIAGSLLHVQPHELALAVLPQAARLEALADAAEAGSGANGNLTPGPPPSPRLWRTRSPSQHRLGRGENGDELNASSFARPRARLGGMLLALWVLGAALGLVALVRDLMAARRLARRSVRVANAALEERVAPWAERVGLRQSPAAMESAEIGVPSVMGWRRPRLLLPARSPETEQRRKPSTGTASRAPLRLPLRQGYGGREGYGGQAGSPTYAEDSDGDDAAIIHELAHVRRGDLRVQAAARLTRALWWWHPLVWLMVRELRNTAEEACDDWVVALTGKHRQYAQVLVQWAEAAQTAGGLGCASRGRALVSRVRRIMEGKQMPMVRLSWQARGALAVCALAVIVAVGAVRVRAVAYGQGPEHELQAEFKLEFYLATEVEGENVEVSEGHTLFEYRDRRFLAEGEPVATDRDIAYTRLRETCHEEDGEEVWEPVVLFELNEEAGARFKQVTGENVGRPMLFVLNGEVVMAPVIRSAIPGSGIIEGMTEQQLRLMAAHWKWDEPPEPAEGTGTIKVTARFADGARPEHAECRITKHSPQAPRVDDAERARWLKVRPKVVGASGDWVIYNVLPDQWGVQVRGWNFPDTERKIVAVAKPGEEATVHFALMPGGTVTGRVVSAETSAPIEDVLVMWRALGKAGMTDAEGRYTLRHAAAGSGRVRPMARGFCFTESEDVRVRDGETTAVADMKLVRGGWIAGKVALREKPGEPGSGWLRPVAEGEVPPGVLIANYPLPRDGSFKVGPLPAGSYRLRASVLAGPDKFSEVRWRGESESVRVEVGETTEGVVIEMRRADQG